MPAARPAGRIRRESMGWWLIILEELPYDDLRIAQGRSAYALLGVAGLVCSVLLAMAAARLWARLRLRPCPHCREFIDRGENACPRCGSRLSPGWASNP